MFKTRHFLVFTIGLLLISIVAHSQGDGPRSYLLGPKGVIGANPKYLNLNQNLVPAGNIYLTDSDINVNVFPTTLFYNFGLGERFAQVQFMFNPANASGTIVTDQDETFTGLNNSGFSDGFMAFKVGLIGTPALSIKEFAQHTPAYSMFGYLRVWYSGSYDASKLLNLGTNRFTIEFGTPMSFPLSKNSKRPIWIESYPYIQLYTKNTDPSIIVQGNEAIQYPLFGIENHLTHNLTKKFWAGIDLRYAIGGESEIDGQAQDNKINVLGGGLSAGYQILPFLGATSSYGIVLAGDNGLDGNMFRLGLVFVYAKTEKN
ncbi:transporter [Algibacter mikhailovii]|uniref:Transporter n=1 Tax=Algibacter mikhailovii TaxID=425498 RepID=A0A918V802_9FLAO|nr:transporter [Algibacter mikhailovii]GGZ78700.1 hypothetical protein GCM10007028_15190 [Algibacter mikhailovii]